VRDRLYIRSDEAVDQVIIHDISGKIRIQTALPDGEVNIRNLSAGLYFVRIRTTSGETVRKIIVSNY
jgi:hypothetical protein